MKQSFLLRLPENRFLKLKKVAKRSGVSINEYLNSLLDKDIKDSNNWQMNDELLKQIKSSSFFKNIKAIILFGSVAKGLDTDSSDCDLLLVLSKESKISRSLYRDWDREIGEKFDQSKSKGREISPHFVKLPDNLENVHGLWLEVAISGIILWKNGLEIDHTLQEIRLAIANNQFLRKTSHGQPYWIRKQELPKTIDLTAQLEHAK